ncbi:MAG: DinB family protein [Acidobacteriota bacterium]
MSTNELERFLSTWERESESTAKLLRALPTTQYDYRPDSGGRSLGELAWHLAEGDAYMTYGIEKGTFAMDAKPPNIERPRAVEALAPGYELVHREAVARIRKLSPEDLDRSIPFFDGRPMTIRDILWSAVISHSVHHRGQLSLMCRLAGGEAPGLYGPNREEMAAMRSGTAT